MRWLVLAFLLGCSASPPPPSGPPEPYVRVKKKPPPEPPPPPKSPFSVIGWSEVVSDKDNPAKICSIDGNIFICGASHIVRLAGEDLVTDPGLELGLPKQNDGTLNGRIDDMLGRYPDDTWAVMRSDAGTSLYRRTAEWSLAKKWKSPTVELMHWKSGNVAALVNNGNERYSAEVVSKTAAIPFAPLPLANKCPQWLKWPHLALGTKQSLIVNGTRCDGDTPAFIKLDIGKLEKHDGMPDLVAPPKGEYSIVSGNLEKAGEEVPMPPPPLDAASTLVPFQVVTRENDVLIAARFKKQQVQGVAILRLQPARKALKF